MKSIVSEKGLYNNVGENNCFLNSAIQVLWHLDVFRKNFRSLKKHNCSSGYCIYCALQNIFEEFASSEDRVIEPAMVRIALADHFYKHQRFQLGQMDDAAECFEYILKQIHGYLCEGKKENEDFCSTAYCLTHTKFAMNFIQQVTCECGATSEPLIFSQTVQYINARHLAKCLDNDFNENLYNVMQLEQNVANCPISCGQKCTIQRTLTNMPDVISFGIIWQSDNSEKDLIHDFVSKIGPSIQLNKIFTTVENSELMLDLVAIVCYYGHHYSTFVLHSKTKIWLLFDDANIFQVGQNWDLVVDRCYKGRYQPMLLIYQNPNSILIQIPEKISTGMPISDNQNSNNNIKIHCEKKKCNKNNTNGTGQLNNIINSTKNNNDIIIKNQNSSMSQRNEFSSISLDDPTSRYFYSNVGTINHTNKTSTKTAQKIYSGNTNSFGSNHYSTNASYGNEHLNASNNKAYAIDPSYASTLGNNIFESKYPVANMDKNEYHGYKCKTSPDHRKEINCLHRVTSLARIHGEFNSFLDKKSNGAEEWNYDNSNVASNNFLTGSYDDLYTNRLDLKDNESVVMVKNIINEMKDYDMVGSKFTNLTRDDAIRNSNKYLMNKINLKIDNDVGYLDSTRASNEVYRNGLNMRPSEYLYNYSSNANNPDGSCLHIDRKSNLNSNWSPSGSNDWQDAKKYVSLMNTYKVPEKYKQEIKGSDCNYDYPDKVSPVIDNSLLNQAKSCPHFYLTPTSNKCYSDNSTQNLSYNESSLLRDNKKNNSFTTITSLVTSRQHPKNTHNFVSNYFNQSLATDYSINASPQISDISSSHNQASFSMQNCDANLPEFENKNLESRTSIWERNSDSEYENFDDTMNVNSNICDRTPFDLSAKKNSFDNVATDADFVIVKHEDCYVEKDLINFHTVENKKYENIIKKFPHLQIANT